MERERERERDVILRGFRVRRRAGHNPAWPGDRSWMPVRLPGSLHLPPLLWARPFSHLYPGKKQTKKERYIHVF